MNVDIEDMHLCTIYTIDIRYGYIYMYHIISMMHWTKMAFRSQLIFGNPITCRLVSAGYGYSSLLSHYQTKNSLTFNVS